MLILSEQKPCTRIILNILHSFVHFSRAINVNKLNSVHLDKSDKSTFKIPLWRHRYCLIRSDCNVYVVVNFLPQVIFVPLLFWGMIIYANEVETKEK